MIGFCALLLCFLGSPIAAFTPYVDIPYEEIVSKRFVLASAEPIDNWGQLPFDSVSQVLLANSSTTDSGAFVLSNSAVAFIDYNSDFLVIEVGLDGVPLESGSRLAINPVTLELTLIVTPTGIYQVSCQRSDSSLTCQIIDQADIGLGQINDVIITNFNANTGSLVSYIASMTGGYYFATGQQPILLQQELPTSVAYFAPKNLLAFGSNSSLMLYINNTLIRRDWATDLEAAVGGVYDGPITSLAFDKYGWLFVGTLACVNILFPNQTVNHLSRFQGLPYNVTTSLSIEYNTQNLWVGTTRGAARWNRIDSTWRYFYLQRYLPGASIVSSLDSSFPNVTIIATDGGIAILQSQLWTLEQKALQYESIIPPMIRLGFVSGCSLSSFGNVSSCTPSACESDAIWTGIVLAATVFRYIVTGDNDAYNKSQIYFGGMQILNEITGITGLIARTVLPPQYPPPSDWYISNTPPYVGWSWQANASSDDVTGHLFSLPIFSKLMEQTNENTQMSSNFIRNLVSYIVKNDYYLIDINGQHTQWGVWNPSYINDNRDWTDERGVNSMQILSYIVAALNITGDPENILQNAYNELTNATNQYDINTINAKIETPIDDNYSDDELTFLPYYTFFTNTQDQQKMTNILLSIKRTFSYIQPLKSSLWNIIFAVALGKNEVTQSILDDIIWSLQTWPIELVDWPTDNSLRQDIFIDPTQNRDLQLDAEALTVLPCNERTDLRWNGNPFDLIDGTGFAMVDPGAFLLPYWMARYHGLIV